MCRGESHFSQKWPLANVGESGESEQNRLANVGESGESDTFPKKAILASTRIRQKWQISGEYSNSLHLLVSGHSLIKCPKAILNCTQSFFQVFWFRSFVDLCDVPYCEGSLIPQAF